MKLVRLVDAAPVAWAAIAPPVGRWFVDLAVVTSQAFNALILRGSPDETVSARCYRQRNEKAWGRAYRVINALYFWQDDHCAASHADDMRRAEELLGSKPLQ